MADCLDDAEFWLPPQFLTDEDFLMDRRSFTPGTAGGDGVPLSGLGYGSGSGLSSPVDSLLGSLEAESDEEDLMADLTRKMAHSTLDDGFKTADSKVRLPSCSPQSTPGPRWDMLCEAAEEVARIRLSEQLYGLSRGGEALYVARGRRSPTPVPLKTQSTDGVFNYSHHQNSLPYQQLVANQIQQLKQHQALIKQQQQQHQAGATWGLNTEPVRGPYNSVQACGKKLDSAGGGRQLAPPAASAWPSLQQRNGASTRAVFLAAPPTGKRECAGTGVFLPRHAGSKPEPRKKPACSAVLLPDKVVRALNLTLENMGAQPHLQSRINGCFASENDCVWSLRRSSSVTAQQNRTGRPQLVPLNNEIRLPQEWTY